MRKLAAFTVSFALGICLAQYLLPERLLLPVAAVFFAAACLALLLPGLWRKRVGPWPWGVTGCTAMLYGRLLRPCPAARAPLP